MSRKSQLVIPLNWQSTSPITGFLPLNVQTQFNGSVPSGTLSGTMSSTNTIYSQIVNVSLRDNLGIEVTWTGTPTGTFSVLGSASGMNFYALTFSPSLNQPAGSAAGNLINLNQFPWTYFLFQYTNSSGSGTVTAYLQAKDLN